MTSRRRARGRTRCVDRPLRSDAAEVPLLVPPRDNRAEAEGDEDLGEQLVLLPAELGDKPPPWPQEVRGRRNNRPEDLRAVAAAIERLARLVALDVTCQEPELGARHVGSDGRHHVERPACERLSEITLDNGHPVASGAAHRSTVRVDGDNSRTGDGHECECDGTRASAQVGGEGTTPARGEDPRCPAGERLGLRTWHVDTSVDVHQSAAELGGPGDPGERLTLLAPGDEGLQRVVVRRSSEDARSPPPRRRRSPPRRGAPRRSRPTSRRVPPAKSGERATLARSRRSRSSCPAPRSPAPTLRPLSRCRRCQTVSRGSPAPRVEPRTWRPACAAPSRACPACSTRSS